MALDMDAKRNRIVMAALCEVQRAAGNAGMAYLSGGRIGAHIRRIRDELDKLELVDMGNGKPRHTGAERD